MGGFGSGHGSGGKRAGAGRPPTRSAPQSESCSFRITPKEKAELKRRAGLSGLSVSEYIKMKTISGMA
jgi:hypothetical protein